MRLCPRGAPVPRPTGTPRSGRGGGTGAQDQVPSYIHSYRPPWPPEVPLRGLLLRRAAKIWRKIHRAPRRGRTRAAMMAKAVSPRATAPTKPYKKLVMVLYHLNPCSFGPSSSLTVSSLCRCPYRSRCHPLDSKKCRMAWMCSSIFGDLAMG